ncbi:MAG: acyl--CoA ligase [Rhizobiales bacterium]|nr:acyl--CoA ligase [Hyphomicrobiales bacterium]
MSGPGTDTRNDAGMDGVRLDAIFRRNAARRPDALALIDPPNREAFTDGAPRKLTYADAERAVARLALMLRRLGLPPRAVVALQLPNTVEAVIALLAVLRAGFVAAPLPLLWRRAEGAVAMTQVSARALITCGRIGETDHGAIALQIAADTFSVRYVCGFGTASDGVVPLDDIFSQADEESEDAENSSSQDAAIAVVTFDTATGSAAARGHTALLVGGLTTVLEADLSRNARIINTMLPSSFATLATAVVPWILTGGTLALHHPFDPAALAEQIREGADAVVVPAPLVAQFGSPFDAARLIAIWRDPQRCAQDAPSPHGAALVDVLAFGEAGIIAARRSEDGRPARFASGPRYAPHGASDAPMVLQITRTARGTLALSGPMLPVPLPETGVDPTENAGPQDTGYPCHIDPANGALTITGTPAGVVNVGGYCFVMSALHETMARVDAGSMLAALPDPLAGQKLAGAVGDPAAMRHALAVLGVNPLIANAFRDPRREPLDMPVA